PASPGGHATRPRARVRPNRRQHLPGRAFARATLLPASGRRLGAIPNAHQEPLHVRVSDASGRRHHGSSGQTLGAGDPQRRQGSCIMAEKRDVVIIGGGHNGLVTAFYLAKAGFKPLVLERRAQTGGAAITEEFHPGFKCSTLAHTTGPIRPDILRDMQLEKHGLKLVTPEVGVVSVTPDGRALCLYNDPKKSAQEIAKFSEKDAAKYPELQESIRKMGGVIGDALRLTPPNIDDPSKTDLWGMLQTGRALRKLGKKDLYRLLRWGPMAVADLVAEYFETDLLRGTIAARGVFGTFFGPWSAGSALVLLLRGAGDPHPAGSAHFAAGGIGSVTQAMAAAAKAAGAEIRTNAEIAEIQVKDGVATAVVLKSGEEIPANAIISNADPKRTLLKLVDPTHLAPDF